MGDSRKGPCRALVTIDRPFYAKVDEQADSIELPVLKSLDIAGIRTDCFSMRIIRGTRRLKKLRVLITHPTDVQLLAEILETLRDSLEELDVRIDPDCSLEGK